LRYSRAMISLWCKHFGRGGFARFSADPRCDRDFARSPDVPTRRAGRKDGPSAFATALPHGKRGHGACE